MIKLLKQKWEKREQSAKVKGENDVGSSSTITAFSLLVTSKIPCQLFEQLWYIFQDKLKITSEYTIFCHMSVLSGVKPMIFNCCPNSCITYTTKYLHHQSWPFCNEPHFKNGKAHHSFIYFPLIPQLEGYFQSVEMIKKMSYQSYYQQQPDKILDTFGGAHYKWLLRHQVIVDGIKLSH